MKLTDKIKENYSSEVMLLSVACFLAGVVAGILLAPVKNGLMVGCHNGCDNKAGNYKNCKVNTDDEDDDDNIN